MRTLRRKGEPLRRGEPLDPKVDRCAVGVCAYQPATTPVPRALPRKRKFKLGEIDTLKDSGVSALEIDRDALPQGSIKEHSMKLYGKEVGKLTGYNRPYSIAGVIAVVDNAGTAKTILDLAQAPLGKNLSVLDMNPVWAATFKLPNQPETAVFFSGDVTTYLDNIELMKGQAVYKGNASRYDTLSARTRHIGETTLHVNFDEKTIEGEIKTDDHRRNILLEKTQIKVASSDGSTKTQEELRQQITSVTTQINSINSEINKIRQGSTNSPDKGLGNALGESTERNGPKLSDEQIAQIKAHQAQIETLKTQIEGLKNTGNSFEGKAVAVGNHYFNTVLGSTGTTTNTETTNSSTENADGTYRGRFFGPNAEEATGFVIFDEKEDATIFSTVRQ